MAAVVDVHTHVVPSHIPVRANASRQWPSISVEANGDASVLIDGKVFRKIDSRCWDVPRRIADMADDGVDFHVLSPMPELLSHWLDPDEAEALADTVNADILRMIGAAPDKFAGIGMVAMQDPARAVRQLAALKQAGMRGIEIGSHINKVPLGSETLFPVWEAAADLGLSVFVHPLHPLGVDRIGSTPDYAAIAAFPLETALAAVSLLAGGVMERFPRLQVLLSHGGGALPWILPRLDQGWSLGGNAKKHMKAKPSDLAKRFWYDTILYSDPSLAFLNATVGADRILVGSDYPFVIRQTEPGVAAARALGADAPCLHRNAETFLGMPIAPAASHTAKVAAQ